MLFRSLVLSIVALTLSACNLSGTTEKGPFKANSAISLAKLNNQANPIASKTIRASVYSNTGKYSITNIRWSGWAELQVSGQYFNEFTGSTSNNSITLNAITKKDRTFDTANINVFTHLAAARMRHLVANGQSRNRAWKNAQRAMKRRFGLYRVTRSFQRGVEKLSLSQGSGRYRKDNANLLLFTGSFMAAGGNQASLASLTADFADDGQFNGQGSTIFNATAAMGATDGMIDNLSSNLQNYGINNPPNAGDLPQLPIWVNQNAGDTEDPVVTVTGQNPVTIVVGTSYIDEGATAVDNVDGALAAPAINGSDIIDTAAPSTHTVTYEATDAAGNTGQATRTVIVVLSPDTEAPVITLTDGNTQMLEVHTGEVIPQYQDPGYTVTDNRDTSVQVNVTGTVDLGTIGDYEIVYSAIDTAGNPTSVTRTVTVKDSIAPVVTLIGDPTKEIYIGFNYQDEGATAVDAYEGVLTVVSTGAVDTNTLGTYELTFTATDSSNNSAFVTRSVTVIEAPDLIRPVLTLVGDTPITVEAGTSYTDAGATASDNKDGDITSAIEVGGAINVNVPATYILTYNVQDSATNAAEEIIRTVIVEDTIAPTLTLSGITPLVIQKDTNYTDAGATATDSLDGDITANIVVNNPVNTSTPETYTVTYTVSDAAGNPAEAITRSVRVNAPPTANAGADVTVITGNSVDLVGVGSDVDGATTVTYKWLRGATVLSTTATYSYTPTASETLTLEVTDSDGAVSTDTVDITVNLPAPYQIVFINDTTEVPRNLDSALFTQGLIAITSVIDSNGDVVADAVPTFDVSVVDFSTPATYPLVFSYTDSYNRTITNTLTVIVVNHAPIVTSDNITVDEDTANNAITLIARDTDQGDTLTYTYTQATNGIVTGTGKNLAYTPNANYAGSDSFTFTVSDGIAESTGTINITVTDIPEPNTAPVASSQSVSVDEDSNIAITLEGTDADAGDTLTYSITEPSNGVLSGSGANVTYTPNANYAGTDSFDFTVSDGTDSDRATVSITVNPLGDAPVATPQPTIVVDEDSSNTPISLSGTDADGDTLIFEDISGSTLNGTLELVADGTNQNYRYTPDEDYSGSDSFTFTVSDGTLTSVPVTINISVTSDNNHAPVGDTQATITVAEDSSSNVIPTLTATDADAGDTLTFEDISGSTTNGTLELVADGTNQNYRYTPDEDYSGSDSFTFTVTDGDDESVPVTINISVTPDNNHAPVGNTQATITVAEDSSNNVIPILTATDADAGDTLTFEDVSGSTTNGTLELVADGTNQNYTYTPDAGYVGADSFTFTVSDGDDVSAEVTINIEVEASVNSQSFNIAIGDIVTDGQPAVGAGNIEDSTSVDIYTFTATAGQNVGFDFKNFGSAGNNSFGFNTHYIVKDSLGTELLNQRMTLSQSVVIPTTGDYTVTVDTIGNYVGTYQLQLKAPYSLVFTNNPLHVTAGTTPDEFDNLLTNNTSTVAEFADSYIPVLVYNFNTNNLLTEGSYPLTVTHTDDYGRTVSKDITIIVDSGVVADYQILFSQNPLYVEVGSDVDDLYYILEEVAMVVDQNGDLVDDGFAQQDIYIDDTSVAGTHTITYTYYDDFEREYTATLEVIIGATSANASPVIGTLFTLNRTVGTSITIDNSTPAAYDTDGTIVSYSWTENGVEIATTASFQYTPTTVGEHRLTLKVVDNNGAFTLGTKIVNITEAPNTPPTANAGRDKNVEVNNSVHIVGSGTDSDGTITAYSWTENGTSIATTAEFNYTPSTVGDHTLTLTVTDNRGGTAIDSIIVTATAPNQAPIANAGADTSVEVNSPVTLSGSASTDDNGIIDYSWYENGVLLHSSSHSNYSYTPTSEGTHTITLTVMDDDEVTASDTVVVTATPAVILSATCPASPATEAAFIDRFVNFEVVDTPWPSNLNYIALTVDQIASVFNAARSTADQFGLKGKALVMPTQAVWDGFTNSQKALYLINSERCARGILPYEGISPTVETNVAQYYAQYLKDNNVFGHNEDGRNPFERLSQLAGVVTPGGGPNNADFFSYAENLASNSLGSTGSFPTVHEPVAKAIYAWMYDDKEDTKTNINEPGATPHYIYTYGHRKFILATGLVENSGEANKEGLIGIGVSTVQAVEGGFNWTKTYTVMNAFDPNENWPLGNIQTVDLLGSNQCLDGYVPVVDSSPLVCEYHVVPGNSNFNNAEDYFSNESTPGEEVVLDFSEYYIGEHAASEWSLVTYDHTAGPTNGHIERDDNGQPVEGATTVPLPAWLSINPTTGVITTQGAFGAPYGNIQWTGVVEVLGEDGLIYISREITIHLVQHDDHSEDS